MYIILLINNQHLLSVPVLIYQISNILQELHEFHSDIFRIFFKAGVYQCQPVQWWSFEVEERKQWIRFVIWQRLHKNGEIKVMVLRKVRLSTSPGVPGLWCAMSKHWFSSNCCCWTKQEYHISISFTWLGKSGLKIMTTPWESFIRAGQQVSNLEVQKKKNVAGNT